MTAADFLAAHPVVSLLMFPAAGYGLSLAVAAAVEPFRTWRRPGDCPRCGGTGRDRKVGERGPAHGP